MTTLARCQCGAKDLNLQFRICAAVWARYCITCGARGPWCEKADDADAAWNALMRPRPVAEWAELPGQSWATLWLGSVVIGRVTGGGAWFAQLLLDGSSEGFETRSSARAWLKGRVRAQGFDVRETEGESDEKEVSEG